jgi:hypothetical protein
VTKAAFWAGRKAVTNHQTQTQLQSQRRAASPASLGPLGSSWKVRATLGKQARQVGPAGEAAAEPRGHVDKSIQLPHNDPLPLHVQLVQSQLVRKRHFANTARAREAESSHSSGYLRPTCTTDACRMRSTARAGSAPAPPPNAPPSARHRPFPAVALGARSRAAAIGRSPKGRRAAIASKCCPSARGLVRRAASICHVLHAVSSRNLPDWVEREATPWGPQVGRKGTRWCHSRTWRAREAASLRKPATTAFGKAPHPHPLGIPSSPTRSFVNATSFWETLAT